MLARVLGLAVLVVTSCGGGGAPAQQAPAGGGATAPAAAATAAPSPAKVAGPSFLDVVGSAKSASYKITYKFTTTAGGQSQSGEQTWYVKPPKMRYDFSTGADTTSVFALESGTFVCTAAGGQKQCFGTAQGQGLQQNQGAQVETQVREKPDQFDPTYEGTRSIAGQTAQCYALKGTSAALAGGEFRMCYTAQGILLLMQSTAQSSAFTMEATSVGPVSDADFQLPAQPVTY